jgi:copper oxidase (laccase) domain-containing protein
MPIDLRRVLAARALDAGVSGGEVSMSTHCTLCTQSDLFSHRGGDAGRQVGFVAVRQERRAG